MPVKYTFLKKLLLKFLVYTPFLTLFSLILIIYLSFIFNFNKTNLITEHDSNISKVSLTSRSILGNSSFLIILISVSTFNMIINMIRVIISDPGYFPSPTEIEEKIVLMNVNFSLNSYDNLIEVNDEDEKERSMFLFQKKINFLNDFNKICLNSPLFSKENEQIFSKIKFFLSEKSISKTSFSQSHISFDNTMISNENQRFPVEKQEENEEIFSNFSGIDLTKAVLCSTCLRFKIERAHHCRLCGKCVLKMDHHCPWLANCIGFNNYKFFLLIQIYGFISSFIVLSWYWKVLYIQFSMENSNFLMNFFHLFVYFCNFGLFSFITWLIYVNWRLLFKNMTVIENSDKERFPTSRALNIYDLGFIKNFLSVFGTNPFTWMLPVQPNIYGKGLFYENIYRFKGLNDLDEYV